MTENPAEEIGTASQINSDFDPGPGEVMVEGPGFVWKLGPYTDGDGDEELVEDGLLHPGKF